MSEAKMGHGVSEETRRKLREANTNPSAEVRWKIGTGRRGKVLSDETRRKMSEAHKARWALLKGRLVGD